jgi:hypothetical protein
MIFVYWLNNTNNFFTYYILGVMVCMRNIA